MQKHLLVTISDDPKCLYGVHFVGSFFRKKEAVKVTLFYVAPHIGTGEKGKSFEERSLDKKLAETYRKKGEEALEMGRKLLCNHGLLSENINTKLIFKQFGTVKDISREAKSGMYDAVVLGRRGYAIFENVLADSVTKEILDHDIDFPLWISRRPEEDRKNVLLCVDGSEPSLRIADHVGFMLKNEEEHSVTVFYVDTGEGANVESVLEGTKKELMKNGLPEERINTSVVRASRVVKTILEETEKKAYAVVAVGRVGVKKGLLKGWLVGSRSMKLLESLEKASLWVSK